VAPEGRPEIDPLGPTEAAGSRARPARRWTRWLPWLVGAAILVGVIVIAARATEARQFLRLLEHAEPAWVLVALLLQAGTYLAEAEGWRIVGRLGGATIPVGVAYRLSLAKIFIDQALPSAGISGTFVFARSLAERGVPRPVVMAAVVVDLVSYYAAYVLSLIAALVISLAAGETNAIVVSIALGFILFGVALGVTALVLTGRSPTGPGTRLARWRIVRSVLAIFEQADPRLTRDPILLVKATLCQLGVFMLDAATLAVLLLAVAGPFSPHVAFASFMIASLFRTVGIVPGGLGTFEATAVLTLNALGIEIPVALSATLLFRGLSFWLPLVPGLVLSRHVLRAPPPSPPAER